MLNLTITTDTNNDKYLKRGTIEYSSYLYCPKDYPVFLTDEDLRFVAVTIKGLQNLDVDITKTFCIFNIVLNGNKFIIYSEERAVYDNAWILNKLLLVNMNLTDIYELFSAYTMNIYRLMLMEITDYNPDLFDKGITIYKVADLCHDQHDEYQRLHQEHCTKAIY